jgi:hypothetical protein
MLREEAVVESQAMDGRGDVCRLAEINRPPPWNGDCSDQG